MRKWEVHYVLTNDEPGAPDHVMRPGGLDEARSWWRRLKRSQAVTKCWLESPRKGSPHG